MNEMCMVVADMERNGICIDVKRLDELEQQYGQELLKLEYDLNKLAWEAMGDTPVNLSSPEQLSMLLYSRRVTDKKQWKEAFNIGSELRNSTVKSKHTKYYSESQFNKLVRSLTEKVYKTKRIHCTACNGTGKYARIKKDGALGVPRFNCLECSGRGVVYHRTKEYAGFKIPVRHTDDITANGFGTDKGVIAELIKRTNNVKAHTFLEKMDTVHAFRTYLQTFIKGIRNGLGDVKQGRGILHPQYMQTVTATGRLSSRSPNFHNQPRGSACPSCERAGCYRCAYTGYTFPIRGVVVSRWPGGSIGKADYSQLEFRTAAELSRCSVAIQSILENRDVHTDTMNKLLEGGQKETRQSSKTHTFKPLYGGTSGTAAERLYYKWFKEYYNGITNWQKSLEKEAISTKEIILPSGRTYSFPLVKRLPNGRVSFQSQIYNYPVQGFATADIVPAATVAVWRAFQRHGFRSLLINEVHDEIVWDCYPGEEATTISAVYKAMMSVPQILKERYNYEIIVPIEVEVSMGHNWLELEKKNVT